jgi:S-formylglutathione hydrolase FrmB
MRNPELFAACVPLSSAYLSDNALSSMDEQNYARTWGPLFGEGLAGEERLTGHWRKYSPLHLAQTMPVSDLKKVRWYIDCGDDDFLTTGNAEMHMILTERQVPHEFRMRDGGHSWEYWRTGIAEGLRFIAPSFRR